MKLVSPSSERGPSPGIGGGEPGAGVARSPRAGADAWASARLSAGGVSSCT